MISANPYLLFRECLFIKRSQAPSRERTLGRKFTGITSENYYFFRTSHLDPISTDLIRQLLKVYTHKV